jgi:hypothetical protein
VTEDEIYVGMRVVNRNGTPCMVLETSKVEDQVEVVVAPDDEAAAGNCTCGCEECCGPVRWLYRIEELRPA